MQNQEIKSLLEKRKLDEAEKLMQTSDLSPADLLLFKTQLLFLRQKYKEALALAEEMLRENPNSAVAYRWKAEILDDGFHDYKTSVECSSKAIELDPSYAEAYVIRGNAKRWMKPTDNKGVIEDYNQALKYDKSNSTAYSGIGWALLEMPGKSDEALQKFTAALCFDSSSYAAYQGISAVFHKKDQLDKAIEYINKAIEINPDAYYLYETRALYRKRSGKSSAEEVFDDYCIAFQKISCKKDFDFSSFFDAAYKSGKMEKAAGLLWSELDHLPKREDILSFHWLLVCDAEGDWLNLILTKGLPADYRTPGGKIWFHELICGCEKYEDFIKIPISKNLLCKVNEEGLTPLGVAVRLDTIDIGRYLLSAGSSADEFIASPWMTPFAMAITLNKRNWVELFLESGANVNHPLKRTGSYLTLACRLKHWEIAQTLLDHGADPNHPGLTGDMQPLRFCDPEENKEIVEKLLAKGARLEYARSLAGTLLEKRKEKLKSILNGDVVNQETFNDFFAWLDIKSISEKESKIIQKAKQAKSDLIYDENRRFAIQMSESCQSVIVWPKDDAYYLIEMSSAPKDESKKQGIKENSATQSDSRFRSEVEQNRTKGSSAKSAPPVEDTSTRMANNNWPMQIGQVFFCLAVTTFVSGILLAIAFKSAGTFLPLCFIALILYIVAVCFKAAAGGKSQ